MWQERLNEFVTLFVVLSPFGAVPIFLVSTVGLAAAEQRRVALYAAAAAFGILLFFIVAGGFILKSMGVAVRAFQIAGGIVLFVFAVTMVLGSRSQDGSSGIENEGAFARAIYPLAIPTIAGPGSMLAVIVLTDDDRSNVAEKLMTVGILALVLVIQYLILLAAAPIARWLGTGGVDIVKRVFGMLLAALAVNIVLNALVDWLALPKL